MRLTAFRTVRGRLLALLVAIALPIACLTAIAAVTTYRTVIAAIRDSQIRAVDDFAVRTRVWYRGALRALLSAGTVLTEQAANPGACERSGHDLLARVHGYRAIRIATRDARSCSASLDPALTPGDLAGATATLKAKAALRVWSGAELGSVRYDYLSIGGKRYLAIYVHDDGQAMTEGVLLADPDLLDQVFDLGEGNPGLAVALVNRGGDVVATRGPDEQDLTWLPAREVIPEKAARWDAESHGGGSRAYAARMMAEPDLYVIASFDDVAEQAARMQFLVLLFAPLLTLALLCFVYLRAIDRHCVRWLRGIEAAARTRATLSSARAIVADDMPDDIRSVANAFNQMVDDQEVRQRPLQTALDDNRFLVRELHHRVKNSLQVVQSYIGLTKRDYRGEARLVLADAECRVHVLSAAYRFTLADGEMQPVRVDLFVDDVVTMIFNLLRSRDQWVAHRFETQASLPVDRIIPLGFLIVDVVARALRSTPGVSIVVALRDLDARTIEIAINADREVAHSAPPRLFAGLLAQIEALETKTPEGKGLGAWRISH